MYSRVHAAFWGGPEQLDFTAEGQKHWAGLEQRLSLSWKQILQDTWVSQGLSSSLDMAVPHSAEEYFRAIPKVTGSGLLVLTLELAA